MRRRALIIGVSNYDKLERLEFCQNDVEGMYEVLRWAGYDIPDHNKLTGYVSRESIRMTAIDFFIDDSISHEELLLFYYSGHGVLDIHGEMYLAPSETDPDSPYKNGFSIGELTKMAQKSSAKNVVLILDCCYSGSAKLAKRFDTVVDGEGICILASSLSYQIAVALLEKNHSAYTYYLINGLKGGGLEVFDHSQNITVDTLSSYVYKKMDSLLGENQTQRPIRKIEASGDIILVDNNHFPNPKSESKSEYKNLPAISSNEVLRKLSPSITITKVEKTFRTDFVLVLSNVLARHGLDLKDDVMISVYGEPVGFPDLLILQRGMYQEKDDVLNIHPGGLSGIIETKHPKRYATEGLQQLMEYCKLLAPEIGFVTNFKNLIEYRLVEHGYPTVNSQTLGSIANKDTFRKIAAFILHEIQNPPPKLKEISDESLVKVLQNCLTDIQSYFVGDLSGLADTLGIFQISYDRDLFNPDERYKPVLQDLIRKAASFVILNQIVFYIALEHRTSLVEQIENLSSLRDLQQKFDHISQTIDYKAVFGARVVSSLPEDALKTINALISNLEDLNFYDIKREILGKIYHNLIPRSIRKRIAAYYTSNAACELLARLTIKKGTDNVLDPSCGSGGFLIAAYKVKKEVSNPPLKHKDLIRSLYGFDISTFASHLSVINLTLQDLRDRTNEVYVTVDDAFNKLPAKTIELLESTPIDSRTATIDGISSTTKVLPSFDVILMNPPFTRIERLEDKYKDYLVGSKGIFREYANYFKGQSGLHCFFLVHIKHLLVDGGYFGAVLPAATFSSEYGNMLRHFILDNYQILYIFAYERKSTFSVDCDWKEILLVGIKGKAAAQLSWKAKVIVLKKELEISKLKSFVNQFRFISEHVDSESYSVRIISKQEFKTEWNWMTFTRPPFLKKFVKKIRSGENITNQEDVIQFHTGYHTDALFFFRLPNETWSIEDGEIFVTLTENATNRQLNIPKQYLIPTLGVPELHTRIGTEMKNYILAIPESEPDNKIPRDLKEYIDWGSSFKESEESRYISDFYKISNYTKSGKRWYTYGNHILYRQDPFNDGKILIGAKVAMVEKFRTKTRKCIAFYSDIPLIGSDNYFFGVFGSTKGLTLFDINRSKQETVDADKILAAWFSSTLFLALYMYYRREISGDYGRIKIGDMSTFPCINPSLVSEHNRQSIVKEFENLIGEELPTIYDQLKTKKLKKLDEAILKAIGIEDIRTLLDSLYTDLIEELDRSELYEDEVAQ